MTIHPGIAIASVISMVTFEKRKFVSFREKKTVLKDFDHQNLLCCFKKSFQICLNFCRSCIWDLIVAFVLSQLDNSFYESCAHFSSNAASSLIFA